MLDLDEMGPDGYARFDPPGSHWPNGFLAGTDRIAVDAVGVAILKELGSNREIMDKKIFVQEQIAQAA